MAVPRATTHARPSGLPARLRPLRDGCVALWRGTPAGLPPFGDPVPWHRQWRSARATARLIDELAGGIAAYPAGSRERDGWRRQVRVRLQDFGEVHFGWPAGYRRLVFGDAFYDTSVDFVRRARAFDPALSLEDLGQALRNVWIANSLQMLFAWPVSLGGGLFAYSMLYPATDNVLDAPDVPLAAKQAFNERLGAWLGGERPAPDGAAEAGVLTLVDAIDDEFPRRRYPGVWSSLQAIHGAQIASLRQQQGAELTGAELLELSVAKGGASVMTDAYLVAGEPAREAERFAFSYGAFLQLLDDLQDVESDLAAGHQTLFTRAAASGPLDVLTGRLARFMDAVLDTRIHPRTPAQADCLDLIRRNCRTLIVSVVAEHPHRFTRPFRRRLQREWPVTFRAMRALRRRAVRRARTTKEDFRRKHGVSSPLELLLDSSAEMPG